MSFLCFASLWAFTMSSWATIVAVNRGARFRWFIFFVAFACPVVAVCMLFIMGIAVMAADDVDALTAAMPSVLGIVYVAGSIFVVVWAYRARTVVERRGFPVEPRGFPIEPIKSIPPKDSDPV